MNKLLLLLIVLILLAGCSYNNETVSENQNKIDDLYNWIEGIEYEIDDLYHLHKDDMSDVKFKLNQALDRDEGTYDTIRGLCTYIQNTDGKMPDVCVYYFI